MVVESCPGLVVEIWTYKHHAEGRHNCHDHPLPRPPFQLPIHLLNSLIHSAASPAAQNCTQSRTTSVLTALRQSTKLSVPATFQAGIDSGTSQQSMWVGACPVGINDTPAAFAGERTLRSWPVSLCRGVPLTGDSPLTFSQARRACSAFCCAPTKAAHD